MLKCVDYVNKLGSKSLEDSFYESNRFAFVLDGASSLIKTQVTSYGSDPMWLAWRFEEEISKMDHIEDPKEVCHEIMSLLKDEFDELNPNEQSDDVYPSGGISLVYETGDKINLFQLGDCPIMIKEKNGRIKRYSEAILSNLDAIAINEMVEIAHRDNIDVKDAREGINETLMRHRRLKNHEDGYMILEPTGAGIDQAYEYVLDKKNVDSILIMTDGFSACIDSVGMYKNNIEFFADCETTGLETITNRLFELQAEDTGYNKYPRFKQYDDATAVLIKVE